MWVGIYEGGHEFPISLLKITWGDEHMPHAFMYIENFTRMKPCVTTPFCNKGWQGREELDLLKHDEVERGTDGVVLPCYQNYFYYFKILKFKIGFYQTKHL